MAKAPATPRKAGTVKAAPAKTASAKAVKAAAPPVAPPVAKAEAAVVAAQTAATEAPAQAAEAHQAATGLPPPEPPGGDPVTQAAKAAEDTMTASAARQAQQAEPEQDGAAPQPGLDPTPPNGLIPLPPDGTAEEMLRMAAVQLVCVGMSDAAQFMRRMCVVAEAAATALLRRELGLSGPPAEADGFKALEQHLKTSVEAYAAMNKAALAHARDVLHRTYG